MSEPEEIENEPLIENSLLSATRLAECLSTSSQMIYKLSNQGLLERIGGEVGKTKGKFHLKQSFARYMEWMLKSNKSDVEKEYQALKRDKMEQEMIQSRLETKEMQGQSVDVKLVMSFLSDMVIRTRFAVMSVPNRLSRKINDREIIELMKAELRRTLSTLSRVQPSDIKALRDGFTATEDTDED